MLNAPISMTTVKIIAIEMSSYVIFISPRLVGPKPLLLNFVTVSVVWALKFNRHLKPSPEKAGSDVTLR